MTAGIAVALAFAGLYEQSLARVLRERFTDARISYLVMNAESGNVFAARWEDSEKPVPVGSLVKPFLATQAGRDREFRCRRGQCWLPRGHGKLHVQQALAQSCNVWFLQFVRSLPPGTVSQVAARFGLPEPPSAPDALIGMGRGWSIPPSHLMRAFADLVHARDATLVLEGMALSAKSGTAHLARTDALMKTGTAPCTHKRGGLGDGFAVALFPRAAPRYVLLVRVHGTTGALAARTSGEIMRSIGADD